MRNKQRKRKIRHRYFTSLLWLISRQGESGTDRAFLSGGGSIFCTFLLELVDTFFERCCVVDAVFEDALFLVVVIVVDLSRLLCVFVFWFRSMVPMVNSHLR